MLRHFAENPVLSALPPAILFGVLAACAGHGRPVGPGAYVAALGLAALTGGAVHFLRARLLRRLAKTEAHHDR